MTNWFKSLPAFVFLSMTCFGVYVFAHFWTHEKRQELAADPVTIADVIQGRTALAIEEVYKQAFPFRSVAVGLINAISFGVFGEARGGVLVGSDGWLFTDEEFTWNRSSRASLREHLDFVRTTAAQLRAADIEVVALLVPEKADIYAENLGRVRPPVQRASYYETVLSALNDMEGVSAPDLRAEFLAAKTEAPLFLTADTHWTVQGAGLAAKSAADRLANTDRLTRSDFDLKPQEAIDHRGDLYHFMKFGPFSGLFDHPSEAIIRVNAEAASMGLDDLFADEAKTEVALIGSSYSANPIWSFEAQLRHHLRADLINYATEGSGPFKPMAAFLDDKLTDLPDLKTVIWEMPLRYFDETAF